MAYVVGWLIPNEVLAYQYWDEVTEEELRASLEYGAELSKASSYPFIHTITDVTAVTKEIPFTRTVQIVQDLRPNTGPELGWTIVVGQKNAMIKFTTNVAGQVLNRRMISCNTFDEALAYLKQKDDQLNWDAVDQTLMNNLLNQQQI